MGFEVNPYYLSVLKARLAQHPRKNQVKLETADFFSTDWQASISPLKGAILVLGNFPWVTSAAQSTIGGSNMPVKSNFLGHGGFDAISGKANFDISEWMLLDVLRWFRNRPVDIAMLVKTSVARKVLAHAERQRDAVRQAYLIGIDAKKSFGAAVDACLLVMRLGEASHKVDYDYTVFANLADSVGTRVGHRIGMTVGNLDAFEKSRQLVGSSPQKWRSGVKHDASGVMEFTQVQNGFLNGFGEIVDLEPEYLFPLLKGSDIGSAKEWRRKWVLMTQRATGQDTSPIRNRAPRTWAYLEKHAGQLDGRGSIVYAKSPRFAIFGVGDYAFRPWRIAICGLYKKLRFRLVGPMDGRPVMFDDTVYYVSFDDESEARDALARVTSPLALDLLSSLVFWDEKRPIKTGILNVLDWSRAYGEETGQALLAY